MSKKTPTLINDYERMVPEFHSNALIYAEHMTRYLSIKNLVKNKTVLDIASGSGYGTSLLSKSASKVYGIDVNTAAIDYATHNYQEPNIEYIVGDGETIPLPDQSVDTVVTFETIEHIKDYKKFLREIKRILTPDGLLIISTPNDVEFAEGNHFHLHEFREEELTQLLRKQYKYIKKYYQATWKYVLLAEEKDIIEPTEAMIKTINMAPLNKDQLLYFFFICSNKDIEKNIEPLGAMGEHYSDKDIIAAKLSEKKQYESVKKKLMDELNLIKKSRSYRLATKITKFTNRIGIKSTKGK